MQKSSFFKINNWYFIFNIQIEYKNGKLVSQYGPNFNWMKYMCLSQDFNLANVEAFVDESGDISFETFREIESGQEMVFTFGMKPYRNIPPVVEPNHGKYT